MMPICHKRFCHKEAFVKVGTSLNLPDSKGERVYDPIYMCVKHAKKFIKKGAWDV